MALQLTFWYLALGLAQSFGKVAELQIGQRGLRTSGEDKLIFFKAFLPADTVYDVKNTIVFSDVQHNIGEAYSPSTGVFTAPVTGLYQFNVRLQRLSGAEADITLLNGDRERATTTFEHDWGNHDINSIMKVNKGDHVHVKVRYTNGNKPIQLRYGQFTQFSGYLIRQL